MTTASNPLYTREFGSRPLLAFGGCAVVALLIAGIAIKTGVLLILIASAAALAFGVVGLCSASTRLEVEAGRITRRTRLGAKNYDAATLALSRSGPNVFVLALSSDRRKVVCAFADPEPETAESAFRDAGVTVEAPVNDKV
jgi:hypothetical protein